MTPSQYINVQENYYRNTVKKESFTINEDIHFSPRCSTPKLIPRHSLYLPEVKEKPLDKNNNDDEKANLSEYYEWKNRLEREKSSTARQFKLRGSSKEIVESSILKNSSIISGYFKLESVSELYDQDHVINDHQKTVVRPSPAAPIYHQMQWLPISYQTLFNPAINNNNNNNICHHNHNHNHNQNHQNFVSHEIQYKRSEQQLTPQYFNSIQNSGVFGTPYSQCSSNSESAAAFLNIFNRANLHYHHHHHHHNHVNYNLQYGIQQQNHYYASKLELMQCSNVHSNYYSPQVNAGNYNNASLQYPQQIMGMRLNFSNQYQYQYQYQNQYQHQFHYHYPVNQFSTYNSSSGIIQRSETANYIKVPMNGGNVFPIMMTS